MTALFALLRKDLILYFRDRRALMLNITMPIVLAAFFGYLFGGAGTSNNARIDLALVVEDYSAISQKIVADMKANPSLNVAEVSLASAQEKVRAGKLSAAVHIPAGFGEAAGAALFGAGNKPEITLYYDPSQSAVLAMVKGILTQHIMQHVSAEMFSGAGGRKWVDESIVSMEKEAAHDPRAAELHSFLKSVRSFQESNRTSASTTQQGEGLSVPFSTSDQAMSTGPRYNGYAHSFAGMAVQFILFMAIDAGIGILLTQRQGLWSRQLASPISLNTVLLARAASSTVISYGLLLLIFAVAMLFFQVRMSGSFLGFLGIGLCFAMMTASFGLLIAAFGRTPEAARGIAIFATLMMVMLGGAWVPAFLFPQWLQHLTLVIPTRWTVDGLDAMTWRGLPISAAWMPMAIQLGYALLFGMLALWKFERNRPYRPGM